jgi:regulator of nucleoside diphosphate kinase
MNKKKVFTKYDYERLLRILEDDASASEYDEKNVIILKEYLRHSKLVDPKEIRSNIVTMNTRFSLKNIGNGKKEIFSLVFPYEQDNDKNKISVLSKMGTQVLGSSIGTVVQSNPTGNQYYIIEDILYQPEAAGDFNL